MLAGVFWAGSTFALARSGTSALAIRLFKPQMGAAVMATLTGAYLGHMLRAGSAGSGTVLIMGGAVSALVAAGVQSVMIGRAQRKWHGNGADLTQLGERITMAHQIAGALLVLTVLTMASARFV